MQNTFKDWWANVPTAIPPNGIFTEFTPKEAITKFGAGAELWNAAAQWMREQGDRSGIDIDAVLKIWNELEAEWESFVQSNGKVR